MDLQIEQRERDGIVMLDLEGPLVIGGGDTSLLRRLLFLLESTHHKVVVNLKRISAVDASGVDTLVFSAKRFEECGGRLVLVQDGQTELLNGSVVPESYEQEDEAVASFIQERSAPHYDILEFVQKQNRLIVRNAET